MWSSTSSQPNLLHFSLSSSLKLQKIDAKNMQLNWLKLDVKGWPDLTTNKIIACAYIESPTKFGYDHVTACYS